MSFNHENLEPGMAAKLSVEVESPNEKTCQCSVAEQCRKKNKHKNGKSDMKKLYLHIFVYVYSIYN